MIQVSIIPDHPKSNSKHNFVSYYTLLIKIFTCDELMNSFTSLGEWNSNAAAVTGCI